MANGIWERAALQLRNSVAEASGLGTLLVDVTPTSRAPTSMTSATENRWRDTLLPDRSQVPLATEIELPLASSWRGIAMFA